MNLFNLSFYDNFEALNQFFLEPITVSWQTDIYDPNSLYKYQ